MKRQLAAIVKRCVSPQAYEALRGLYRVSLALVRPAQSRLVAGNLTALAKIHGSDKWGTIGTLPITRAILVRYEGRD
jgi:hypothetical protein